MQLNKYLLNNKNEYKKIAIWALRLLVALLIIFALHSKAELIEPVYPYETIWGCVLMQFAYAYKDCGFSDILNIILLVLVFKFIDEKKIKHDLFIGIFSFVLSIIYLFSLSFREYDEMTLINGSLFQKVNSVFVIAGITALLYIGIRIMFYFIDFLCTEKADVLGDSTNKLNANRIWLASAVIMLICWIPWLIMDYPGSFCVDSIDQLKQFFGSAEWTAHHPPFSTLVLGGCVAFGKALGSVNFGVFIYELIHTISGAAIYSYGIKKMYEWGISRKGIIITTGFFALIPLWGIYAQFVEKSYLYNELIALIVIYIADIVICKELTTKKAILLSVFSIIVCLLRNNGIYTLLPSFVILFFCVSRDAKKRLSAAVISLIIVYMMITKAVYPVMGITGGSKAEMLSVPFMQTARYVYAFEDQVTDEERKAINGVLWYEKLPERYESQKDISDAVKSTYNGHDENLKPYFIVWMKMFFKHPNIYLSAFINNNYGYLAPVLGGVDVNMDYGEEEWLAELGVKHIFTEMPIKFFDSIHIGINTWPVFKYFSMAGTYTWIILIMCLYIIKNKKYSSIPAFMPAVLTILICLASPSHLTLRYMLCVPAVVPIYLAILLRKDNSDSRN